MASQGNDDLKIDVRVLAKEMAETSKQSLFMQPECCIFRAPSILTRHNPQAYIPHGFSIGPYHYNKLPFIQATQKIKHQYLQELISRSWLSKEVTGPDAKLIALTEAVMAIRKEARECYAEKLSLCEKEFVQVLVFDGCFLVELFRKFSSEGSVLVSEDDPVFSMSCLPQYLYHELIVLENQIPWKVLLPLFEITKPTKRNEPSLAQLVVDFFSKLLQEEPPSPEPALIQSLDGSKHILDLLWNLLVKNSRVHENKVYKWQPIPSATRLREAGIEFRCGSSLSILDAEFLKEGVLKIPQLLIHETTETMLRNLICLEQCCPNYPSIVTSYAILMDNLINKEADMELLMKKKVIKNWLNIDDATKFFNNLYDDTCVKEMYYDQLIQEVNEFCKRSWPRHRTVLMHDYFRHPWMLISLIAAALLLVLTFLQTLFTVIT